jgi:hypothetical protein
MSETPKGFAIHIIVRPPAILQVRATNPDRQERFLMSTNANRGLVYEALLDCVGEDIPVTDETIKAWSRHVTEYLHGKGHAIQPRRGKR